MKLVKYNELEYKFLFKMNQRIESTNEIVKRNLEAIEKVTKEANEATKLSSKKKKANRTTTKGIWGTNGHQRNRLGAVLSHAPTRGSARATSQGNK